MKKGSWKWALQMLISILTQQSQRRWESRRAWDFRKSGIGFGESSSNPIYYNGETKKRSPWGLPLDALFHLFS